MMTTDIPDEIVNAGALVQDYLASKYIGRPGASEFLAECRKRKTERDKPLDAYTLDVAIARIKELYDINNEPGMIGALNQCIYRLEALKQRAGSDGGGDKA